MSKGNENTSSEKIVVQVDEDLEDLIPEFLENREKDIETITHALKQGDYETIRVLGHSMKGSGGGFGFDPITEMGGAIETAAKAGDSTTIQTKLDELEMYLKSVEIVFVSEE
jgi:HPt (histidine-containing phosphotransfer) domain-containing protein